MRDPQMRDLKAANAAGLPADNTASFRVLMFQAQGNSIFLLRTFLEMQVVY